RHLPELGRRIEGQRVAFAEIVERPVSKGMPMRWISPGVRAREVRDGESDDGSGSGHPVDLLHEGNYVRYVLDDVVAYDFSKGGSLERPGYLVQVMDDVRTNTLADVDVDGALDPVVAAAEVQDAIQLSRSAHPPRCRISILHCPCHLPVLG